MTQDEIIGMAHECHVPVDWRVKNLVRFANLVAARERESCAKVCEKYADNAKKRVNPTDYLMGQIDGAEICELYIRARGESA